MPATDRSFNRYLILTAVATPANVAVLALLLWLTTWPAIVANLVAASAITVPSFVASALWVWGVADQRARRAIAFWASSIVNVAAASLVVWMLDNAGASEAMLSVTPLAVYTALWFARFLVLDRLVFRRAAAAVQLVPATPTTEYAAHTNG